MTRRIAIFAVLTLALGAGLARAHDGHTHTVMGTVTSSDAQHLEVKTTKGTTVTIVLNDKTLVARGADKLTLADLAAGQRVVVDVGNGKAPLTARQVKVGVAKVAAK